MKLLTEAEIIRKADESNPLWLYIKPLYPSKFSTSCLAKLTAYRRVVNMNKRAISKNLRRSAEVIPNKFDMWEIRYDGEMYHFAERDWFKTPNVSHYNFYEITEKEFNYRLEKMKQKAILNAI